MKRRGTSGVPKRSLMIHVRSRNAAASSKAAPEQKRASPDAPYSARLSSTARSDSASVGWSVSDAMRAATIAAVAAAESSRKTPPASAWPSRVRGRAPFVPREESLNANGLLRKNALNPSADIRIC